MAKLPSATPSFPPPFEIHYPSSPHPVLLILNLSVMEGLLSHSLHPPVLLNVVPHLQVTGVGHKVGMSC